MANKSHALAYLQEIEDDGKSQIIFNRDPQAINRTPKFKAVDVPMSNRGQQQTERYLLMAVQAQAPKLVLAIGYQESLRYAEVHIYDTARFEQVSVTDKEMPDMGKFKRLVAFKA